MCQKVLRLLMPMILLCTFANAQTVSVDTDFISQMNTAFAKLDKTKIPYGLLQDYAFELADLGSYAGTLTDSNYVNNEILHNLYTTLCFADIYPANAGTFYHPNYVDSIWMLQRQPGIITLSGIYYNYSSLRSDAVSNGLVTISNNQIIDKYVNGVWQNPYQTNMVFAMSPPLHIYTGRSFQLKLPSNLFFTNNASAISSFAIDYGDGSGYHTLTKDQLLNVNYSDTGNMVWKFSIKLTNGTTLYSQTQMHVLPEPNGPYSGSSSNAFLFKNRAGGAASVSYINRLFHLTGYPSNPQPQKITASQAYLGQAGWGWVTVSYANADQKMRKPLIVVEGFDPGYLIAPEMQQGITNFNSFISSLYNSNDLFNLLQNPSSQQYDVIYVDWGAGADYLQRNGYLLESIISWVDSLKAVAGSTTPNVVLGQSMGGVISRWALKDMEQKGLNHQTRLFINWDGPMQGANVPLAYQYLSRHLRSLYLKTNVPLSLGAGGIFSNQIALIHYQISNALNLSDFPAAKQMLINHLTTNFTMDNSINSSWEQELYYKGYPSQCRNVAVSNGSECAINQGFNPDATLLNFSGNFSTTFWGDLIGQVGFPLVGYVLGGNFLPFLGGILPGKNTISGNMTLKAQPNAGTTDAIYSCKITYTKKLLWLFNITSTITNVSYNSTPSVLAIDGTEGGYFPIPITSQAISGSSWIAKYGISLTAIPQFNFVPVTSSLDIGSNSSTLTISDYSNRYLGAQPPVTPKNTPFANFITAFDPQYLNGTPVFNEQHIQIATRNGTWVAAELNGNPIVSDCSGTCPNNVISGSSPLCTTGVFSVNATNNSNYTWNATPTGIVSLTSNGNSVTLTKVSNGSVTLTANVSNSCNIPVTINSQPIQVGETGISSINLSWISSCIGNAQHVKLDAIPSSAGTNWKWSLQSGNFAFTNNTNTPSTDGYVTNWAILNLNYNGSICQTPLVGGVTAYTNCSYSLAVSPNPATSSINLSVNNNATMSLQQNSTSLSIDTALNDNVSQQKLISNTEGITNVYLFDFYTNQLIKRWAYQEDNSPNYNLNVAGVKRGIYVLRMERDNIASIVKVILQ